METECSAKYFKFFIFPVFILCLCSCADTKRNIKYQNDVMSHRTAMVLPGEISGRIIKKEAAQNIRNTDVMDAAEEEPPVPEDDHMLPDDRIYQENEAIVQNSSLSPFYRDYSRKMGINFNGTEDPDLLMAIDEWMGTPYLWGGCSEDGIDCSCLVKNIYEKVFGIPLNRTSDMMFKNNIMPVDINKLKTGDILAFDMDNTGISHVGIYLKDNKFVHASLSKGVMISSLDQSYYKKRFITGGPVKPSQSIQLARLAIRDLVVVNR